MKKQALKEFIEAERKEKTLVGNIMSFIVIHRRYFGLEMNDLQKTFIEFGLKDEQGNHIQMRTNQ